MADPRRLVSGHVQALIDGHYGCLDAACETISARLGRSVSKGTLSKRLAGQQGWPADEVMALEDAAGRHPVTRMLARRLNPNEGTAAGCVLAHAGDVARETGEAVSAILAAQRSDAGDDVSQALVEIDEALAALERARARLASDAGAAGTANVRIRGVVS